MHDQTKQPWFQLCQLASVEQDPEKLLALVTEINRLLEAQETERDTRQRRSWRQTPESDQHQTAARQPYLSREAQSGTSANDTEERPASNSSEDSE